MDLKKPLLIIGGFSPALKHFVEIISGKVPRLCVFDLPDKEVPGYLKYLKCEIISGDTTNYKDLRNAMRESGFVLRLSDLEQSDVERYPDFPFGKVIQGTLNSLEAARKTGVDHFVQLLSQPLKRSLRGHSYQLTRKLEGEIAKDFSETYRMNISFLTTGILFDGHRGYDISGNKIKATGIRGKDLLGMGDLSQALIKLITTKREGYQEYYLAGSSNAVQKYEVRKAVKELGMEFQDKYNL